VALLTVCPHCGAKHKLPDDSKVGKKIRCRECEEPFVVEAEEAPAVKRAGKSGGGGLDAKGLPPRSKAKSKTKKKSATAEKDAPKKPKRKSKSSAGNSPALIGLICVLALGLLIGIPLLFFGGDEPMKAPESYAKFQHPTQNTFQCEYPEGWTVDSGGGSGQAVWSKFETGDVKIRVRSSISASAVGDIAASLGGGPLNPGEELPEELAPVAQVHELMRDQFAGDYKEYQESPPTKSETGFGDTRISEFTAKEGFGSKIRGLRASMLGTNLQYTVICDCLEEDWEVCRPIFERVIKSMSRG
jgi:hypothetical protein